MNRNLIILNEQFIIVMKYHKSQVIINDIKIYFNIYEYFDNNQLYDFFHEI